MASSSSNQYTHPPAPPYAATGWFDWAYKGVDHKYPGNGGPECRDFLSVSQRIWESGLASLVALVVLGMALRRLRLPAPNAAVRNGLSSGGGNSAEPLGKRFLLLLMCLTFGIEIGFKLATRQMIWIGNPCHLTTMIQIFILAAPPGRVVTSLFRLQMHMLTGAPIAILFPVINTRLLPFETSIYFLQHILILVIPFYLLKTGDPFIPERLGDFSWAMTSFGFLFLYHFLPLQYLAYLTEVNLNNMLCPAVSDPFHGKYYRLFAIGHQILLIPTLGKAFVLIARHTGLMACHWPPDCMPALQAIQEEACLVKQSQKACCAVVCTALKPCCTEEKPCETRRIWSKDLCCKPTPPTYPCLPLEPPCLPLEPPCPPLEPPCDSCPSPACPNPCTTPKPPCDTCPSLPKPPCEQSSLPSCSSACGGVCSCCTQTSLVHTATTETCQSKSSCQSDCQSSEPSHKSATHGQCQSNRDSPVVVDNCCAEGGDVYYMSNSQCMDGDRMITRRIVNGKIVCHDTWQKEMQQQQCKADGCDRPLRRSDLRTGANGHAKAL